MFNNTLMLIFMIIITLDINKLYKNEKKTVSQKAS